MSILMPLSNEGRSRFAMRDREAAAPFSAWELAGSLCGMGLSSKVWGMFCCNAAATLHERSSYIGDRKIRLFFLPAEACYSSGPADAYEQDQCRKCGCYIAGLRNASIFVCAGRSTVIICAGRRSRICRIRRIRWIRWIRWIF